MSQDRKEDFRERYKAALAEVEARKADTQSRPAGPHWSERGAASRKLFARAQAIAKERRIDMPSAWDAARAEDPAADALATGGTVPTNVVPISRKAVPMTAERVYEIQARLAQGDVSPAEADVLLREIRGAQPTPARSVAPVASSLPTGWQMRRTPSELGQDQYWYAVSPSGRTSPGYVSQQLAMGWAWRNGDGNEAA